jgi:Tfp pilus assembly protein PilV
MKTETHKQSNKAASGVHQGNQGFTLLETSVALVVMMVVGLGAASLFVYAVGANTTARDRELSMAVAQQQMERLRNTPFANLDATVTATGGTSKTVPSGERQYRVATTIANTIAGDTSRKTITVQVTPLGSTTLTGAARIFGGVTLVTQRSSTAIGTNWSP